MKVMYEISKIKNIVEQHAKFQKVFLLYDNNVSNSEIANIYNLIKDMCIFNAKKIDEDITEAYNGYKLIIYYCSANSFINCNLALDEFVNVFLPTDDAILPFYLDRQNYLSNKEDYIILKQTSIDAGVYNSIYFNNFYNYLYQLIYMQTSDITFNFSNKDVTQLKIIEELSAVDKNLQFFDIEIIKKCDIPYKLLPLIDYILSSAFLCFIKAVKLHQLSMVDVYKLANNNDSLIDKYYAMTNNQIVTTIINLNQHFLYTACEKTREAIINLMDTVTTEQVELVIKKIKQYAKQDDSLIGYLYLYNVFGL